MQIVYELESHAPSGPTWARNPRKTNWECYCADFPGFKGLTEVEGILRNADSCPRPNWKYVGDWPMKSPPQPGLDGP